MRIATRKDIEGIKEIIYKAKEEGVDNNGIRCRVMGAITGIEKYMLFSTVQLKEIFDMCF